MTEPVFVFGALRSGTTVFRLMLNAHPEIFNPGELDFLFDFISPDKQTPNRWRYDLDALQANGNFRTHGLNIPDGVDGTDLLDAFLAQFRSRSDGVMTINVHRNIGKILAIWPDCKIIHLIRDPRDVARSSIGMGWAGTHYHGVGHWIHTETDWGLATRENTSVRVCDISFEQLFVEIDGTLARVCKFLDVSFDPAMLGYHKNTTYAPPDRSLVEQWKRKSTLYEIALVEVRAQDLMIARGYTTDQPPLHLGALANARLFLKNKMVVWRFGIHRFGFFVFGGEKFARRLKLLPLQKRLQVRMQEVRRTHLK